MEAAASTTTRSADGREMSLMRAEFRTLSQSSGSAMVFNGVAKAVRSERGVEYSGWLRIQGDKLVNT